ncbi:hypothetical protein AC249_AIPGENE13792 [Exaiptasia diaphana]|nr:hypothetical protein AC249_AIPGENE13792 [Exaiptasia diaphana]
MVVPRAWSMPNSKQAIGGADGLLGETYLFLCPSQLKKFVQEELLEEQTPSSPPEEVLHRPTRGNSLLDDRETR